MKILNLYAGIGGNRKFWKGDITAVEKHPVIAAQYSENYPEDTVFQTDALKYLEEIILNLILSGHRHHVKPMLSFV